MSIVVNGSGTITGISTGGLPDGSVDAGTVAADVATQAEIDAKLSLSGGTMTGNVNFNDSSGSSVGRVTLGTSNDLQIYHNGSHSYIEENGTGNLHLLTNHLSVNSADDTEAIIHATQDAGVSLFHNNSKKLETTADGATITGGSSTGANLTITSTATDDNIAPDLILYRNSASPADNDNLGGVIWQGNDDGGNVTSYAQIVCKTEDVSDGTEDALLRFYTATGGSMSEKMRLTKEGYLGIATTAPAYTLELANVSSKGWSVNIENSVAKMRSRASANDTQTHWDIMNGNGVVGTVKSSSSSAQFNTSSDYRLKENVDYTWDATTRLKQLKPARFNFIADDTNTLVDGFIAHEVSAIVPEAISGAKDAMTTNKNGDAIIDPQGIDQSKLVPLLVKAMQEQQTTIEALTSRITALES